MADFRTEDRRLHGDEGVYSDDPRDEGGETVFGIARKKLPEWKGWPLVDRIKVRLGLAGAPVRDRASAQRLVNAIVEDAAVMAAASELRKAKFWDWFMLDACPDQAVAGEIYNGAFNVGRARQRLICARALNVLNREGKDWPDLELGEPSRLPDGLSPHIYALLPKWVRTPILMVYPANLGWNAVEPAAMLACLGKGRGDVLFKALSGIREEWYVSWLERNPAREQLAGVLTRPFSRA